MRPIHWQVARGFRARLCGLLGRMPPGLGCALLLRPCNAVHTAGMRYPIDLVFISRRGRVLRICLAVPPWRARWCWRAGAVAELAAGEAARLGVRRGMVLSLPD